jgi:hypothetical protein
VRAGARYTQGNILTQTRCLGSLVAGKAHAN